MVTSPVHRVTLPRARLGSSKLSRKMFSTCFTARGWASSHALRSTPVRTPHLAGHSNRTVLIRSRPQASLEMKKVFSLLLPPLAPLFIYTESIRYKEEFSKGHVADIQGMAAGAFICRENKQPWLFGRQRNNVLSEEAAARWRMLLWRSYRSLPGVLQIQDLCRQRHCGSVLTRRELFRPPATWYFC